MLQITEPIPFPIAIPTLSCDAAAAFKAPDNRILCPSTAAIVETMISGSVVAMLITVAPIINFGIFVTSAIHTAPSTNQSPPFTMKKIPTAKRKYIMNVSIVSPVFFILL